MRASTISKLRKAFTLIELLVAVSLMSFIVLGMLAMFSQTQKAFRASMTQTDVLESGRILTDMMGRELAQMAPSGQVFTTNFFAELSMQPLLQGMPGTTLAPGTQDRRTNIVDRLFFLSLSNQTWNGLGYQVFPDYPNAGVGTLYRFSANSSIINPVNLLSSNFQFAARAAATSVQQGAPITNLNRMVDGVVHLRLRAFATNGYPINWGSFSTNPVAAIFRANAFNTASYPALRSARANAGLAAVPEAVDYYFFSNAVPAYVELEVGILEPHILERFKAIGGPVMPPPAALMAAQMRYLSNHVAQVHIFRQRIPIRSVDFSAYQ
jgi:prepilin-type N-terminal cleavage/methylation domain-containing protein